MGTGVITSNPLEQAEQEVPYTHNHLGTTTALEWYHHYHSWKWLHLTTKSVLLARDPTIQYGPLAPGHYSSKSWLKLKINLNRNGSNGKICIPTKHTASPELLLQLLPSVRDTGLPRDNLWWHGHLNMSKGCGVNSNTPEAWGLGMPPAPLMLLEG